MIVAARMPEEKMMSEPNSETKAAAAAPADERLKSASTLQRLLSRPELGAVSGLVLITIFFVSTANSAMFTAAGIMNFMAPASQLGILAVAAALLWPLPA
ncbi:sugar transport system permease [Brucella sp. F5/99]|nr:sugar transport system permease [Brucella sp. F5/99]